jgi:hypothetical protein
MQQNVYRTLQLDTILSPEIPCLEKGDLFPFKESQDDLFAPPPRPHPQRNQHPLTIVEFIGFIAATTGCVVTTSMVSEMRNRFR